MSLSHGGGPPTARRRQKRRTHCTVLRTVQVRLLHLEIPCLAVRISFVRCNSCSALTEINPLKPEKGETRYIARVSGGFRFFPFKSQCKLLRRAKRFLSPQSNSGGRFDGLAKPQTNGYAVCSLHPGLLSAVDSQYKLPVLPPRTKLEAPKPSDRELKFAANMSSYYASSSFMKTPFAAGVDPMHPRPEHPKPQMYRADRWESLNGPWQVKYPKETQKLFLRCPQQ